MEVLITKPIDSKIIDKIINIVLENSRVIGVSDYDYNAEVELGDYERCERDLKKLLEDEYCE